MNCCKSSGLSCSSLRSLANGRTKWRLTVEPVVFLYMLPTFMLLPVLQDLIYTKVCQSKYEASVCSRLNETENSGAMTEVQSDSAHWIQASTIAMCLPSMIVGQILGTVSDSTGRKMPLIVPPLGGVLASLVYVLLSGTVVDLDVSWILLASFLTGMGGGFAACLNTCASYLTQVSPQAVRTSRVGVMECMILVGACVGPLLVGLMLQARYNRDKLFTVMLALHAANVLYVLAFVPNVHASRSVSRLCPSERAVAGGAAGAGSEGGVVAPVLRPCWQRLKQMFGVVCKARHENRRGYLLLLILAAALIMFCTTGQLDVLYLFLKDQPLLWTLRQYTQFSALSYGLGLASLVLVMVPLSYLLSDAVLLLLGAASRLAFLLLLGLANTDALVYTASVAGCAFSWCMPAIRSAMSKLVEPDELGRVFGLLGIVENACTLLASSVFTSLYPLTRGAHHGALFLGAAGAMLGPVAVAGYLYLPLKRLARYSVMESEEDDDDTSAPAGRSIDTDDGLARNGPAELSLGDSAASIGGGGGGGRVPPPLDSRHPVRSISLSSTSSASSGRTPITPITPSSIASGDLAAVSHFPAIVDTNFSTIASSLENTAVAGATGAGATGAGATGAGAAGAGAGAGASSIMDAELLQDTDFTATDAAADATKDYSSANR